jgi:hypothetical protein
MSRPVLIANVTTDTFQGWVNKTNNVASYFVDVVTTGSNATGDITTGNGTVNGFFGANTLFTVTGIRGGTVDTAAHLTVLSNTVFSGAQVNSTANVFVNATNVHIISTVTTILSNSSVTAIKVTGNSSATNTYIGGTALNLGSDTVVVTNSLSTSGPISVTNSVAVSNSILIGSSNNQSIASNNKTTTGTSANLVDSFSGSVYRSSKYFISIKDNDANSYNATELVVLHDGGDSYLTEYARVVSNTVLGVFTTNVSSGTVRLYYAPKPILIALFP